MESDSIYIQKQMQLKDVHNEIAKINDYLSQCMWMDFDYKQIGEDKIILCGCTDQSWREESIEIVFEFPQLVSTLFSWSMDEKKPFIQIASSEELAQSTRLVSERGCYIFKLNDSDSEQSRIFISASGIKCNILKPLKK